MALLGVLLASAPVGDPLAPAAVGQVECYSPDEYEKTCEAIAGYRPIGGGKYSNAAETILHGEGPITLETTSVVVVKNGAVCGYILPGDVEASRVRVARKLLPARNATAFLAQVEKVVAPIMNKEVCTFYEDTADGLLTKSTVNGVHDPDLDRYVKWIDPTGGYRVGSEPARREARYPASGDRS
jgi:hypothetical protein